MWCKQLFADPRASLCIEATAPVAGHVGVDGTVTVHELPDVDIWPMSRGSSTSTSPPSTATPSSPTCAPRHRLLFELRPDVVRAIDMRVYRGKRADRDFQRRQAVNDAPTDPGDITLEGWSQTP